jgi:hypothetical protein
MWPAVKRLVKPEELPDCLASLDLSAWLPKFVVLHNSGEPTLTQWPSTAGALRMANLEHYYRDQLGWSGGPHLFVAPEGIWLFNPLGSPGVHSPSWNHVSWGVEMVGDYECEPFGDPVRGNAVAALAALHVRAGLHPESLRLHREDPLTTHACPGKNVDKQAVIDAVCAAMDGAQ